MHNLTAEVSSQEHLTGTYYKLNLLSDKIASSIQPGQFVMLHCGQGTFLYRPFSVAGVTGNTVEIIYRIAGKGTQILLQKKRGDKLRMFGPLGNGWKYSGSNHLPVLVAGGTGIASLMFLMKGKISPVFFFTAPGLRTNW